jgi:signal transduction histidine kinase
LSQEDAQIVDFHCRASSINDITILTKDSGTVKEIDQWRDFKKNRTIQMTKSAFYKIATDREVRDLLVSISEQTKTAILIESALGEILIKTLLTVDHAQLRRYPIEVRDELVGWAIVSEELAWIPSWFSHLFKQELEKQDVILKVREREGEINLFQDLSAKITSSLDMGEVTHLVLAEAGKFIPCTWGAISLLNSNHDHLFVYSEFGQKPLDRQSIPKGENPLWHVIESQTGAIVNATNSDPNCRDYYHSIVSLVCVPLHVQDKTIGVLEVGSEVLVEYTAYDLKIMTMFAEQAAVAIEKAFLYEQSRNAAAIAQEQMSQLQQALYDLKRTQAQLVQSEKMSSLGELIAGVAHEINNPVNFISGNLTYAKTYVRDLLEILQLYRNTYPEQPPAIEALAEEIELDYLIEDLPQLIASMQEGVSRICQILLSLRNFSRQDRGQISLVNLHDCLDSTLLILQHRLKDTAPHGGIQIIKNYGSFPAIDCYPGLLNQVFMNLLGNAIDAIEDAWAEIQDKKRKPQIRICTEKVNDNRVAIRIADNGIGMTEEVLNQLFDAFFTTKPLGKGTGLGLSICHQIITQKHRGSLQCTSELGKGTEFIIELPMVAASLGG